MSHFNIRVYGLLINEHKQILVTDEYIRGQYFTKFPGGGLEFGEGTRECLAREFIEEMNLKVEVQDHLYTTDFFQRSAFNPNHQIISIYYYVKALEPIRCPLSVQPFQFNEDQMQRYHEVQQAESFRCIDWVDFSAETLSLPIDKLVAAMVKQSGP